MGSDVARAASVGGLVVPPGDTTAFAAALQRLLDDASLREELGRCGRRYAIENWDRETILRNAEQALRGIVGRQDMADGKTLVRDLVGVR